MSQSFIPRPETLFYEEYGDWVLELARRPSGEYIVVMHIVNLDRHCIDYTLAPYHKTNTSIPKQFEKLRNLRWSRDFKPKAWEIVRLYQILEI